MSQISASEAPVLSLDLEKIGNVLTRLALVAHQLGHEKVTGTLDPYCKHPELQSPESRFVYDMFMRPTQEIIARWYGGWAGAIEMLDITIPAAFEPDPA